MSEDQPNTSEDYSKIFEELSALSEGLLILSNFQKIFGRPKRKRRHYILFQKINHKSLFFSCSLKENNKEIQFFKDYKLNLSYRLVHFFLHAFSYSKFARLLFPKNTTETWGNEWEYCAVRLSEEYSPDHFVVFVLSFHYEKLFYGEHQLFRDFNNLMNGHCDTVILKHQLFSHVDQVSLINKGLYPMIMIYWTNYSARYRGHFGGAV